MGPTKNNNRDELLPEGWPNHCRGHSALIQRRAPPTHRFAKPFCRSKTCIGGPEQHTTRCSKHPLRVARSFLRLEISLAIAQ